MIGVIPKRDQIPIVEEFFELFKTPWEIYRPGQRYDVVVATVDEVPEVDARLLLVFGPDMKRGDTCDGLLMPADTRGRSFNYRGTRLPIYGPLLTFTDGTSGDPVALASVGVTSASAQPADCTVIRIGYDLFEEVRYLLSEGQPAGQASTPTLDVHTAVLRDSILDAGLPLVEIPPAPADHSFIACLTHDIDFVGIARHRFDHTMWGFLYRSTVGAVHNLLRRRISLSRLFRLWRAAASLPFVYLGWAKDFWEPFDWYQHVERGLPVTYFLIPFKRRAGDQVPGAHGSRRATAYDITDLPRSTTTRLLNEGCEIGVHGIDAWHCADKGRSELARIATVTGEPNVGIRMHWLLRDADTPGVLEHAGYAYDSTVGFNDTVGYRAGTSQVFRPLGAQALLELPVHIQDGALFYTQRLDLSEAKAEQRCRALIAMTRRVGGVLTLIWHDRSHGPERFWGEFYVRLIGRLRSAGAWFATASQAVDWFRRRREVHFECARTAGEGRACLRYDGEEIHPPLRVRVHQGASTFVDTSWNGASALVIEMPVARVPAGACS